MVIAGQNVASVEVPVTIARHFSLLDIAVVTTMVIMVTVPNGLWKI